MCGHGRQTTQYNCGLRLSEEGYVPASLRQEDSSMVRCQISVLAKRQMVHEGTAVRLLRCESQEKDA